MYVPEGALLESNHSEAGRDKASCPGPDGLLPPYNPKRWRLYWSWKSRTNVGRPRLGTEVRELIRSPKTTRSGAPSASEANCSSLTSPSFDSPIQVAQAEAQGEPDLANLLIESSEGHLGR